MSQQCSGCRYWKPLANLDEAEDFGLCRVNPPVFNPYKKETITEAGMIATGAPMGSFPATAKDDWCGQFKEIEKKRPAAKPVAAGKRITTVFR
jgi:hypothetical protein